MSLSFVSPDPSVLHCALVSGNGIAESGGRNSIELGFAAAYEWRAPGLPFKLEA
jgi:hypothetical protein